MSNWVWFQDALPENGTQHFSLAAGRGAYALSGGATGTTLIASDGAFVLTGNNAGLFYGHDIGAVVTPYVLTGYAIGPFVRGFRIDALRGEYRLSGPTVLLKKTSVPIQNPTPYVEGAWVQPENEGNLDSEIEWEQG